jgi:hypothetical protein
MDRIKWGKVGEGVDGWGTHLDILSSSMGVGSSLSRITTKVYKKG